MQVSEILLCDDDIGEMQLRLELPVLNPGHYSGIVQYEYFLARYLLNFFAISVCDGIDLHESRFPLLIENSTLEQLLLVPSFGPSSGGVAVKILAFGQL